MSDLDVQTTGTEDELAAAKTRATELGLTFHPKIGLENLLERIALKEAEDTAAGSGDAEEESAVRPAAQPAKSRTELRKEALKLIRVTVTSMDPQDRSKTGEIITAGNSVIGTVSKFVPFGVEWHVPQILLNRMREKNYVFLEEKTNKENGQKYHEPRLVKAYAIAELPALTTAELKDLAQRQAMAAGTAE